MFRFAASLLAAVLGLSILEPSINMAFAQVAPVLALPSTSGLTLAAKKKHRESAKQREKRIECEAQAEKLLSDSGRRAYVKECMSEGRQ
jgi:hypothetical protein